MKRLSLLAVVLVLALGCGSKSPTTPSTNPNQFKFTAALSPSNEVPPVTDSEASGRGTATVTMNVTKDAAGTITAATFDFTVDVTADCGDADLARKLITIASRACQVMNTLRLAAPIEISYQGAPIESAEAVA